MSLAVDGVVVQIAPEDKRRIAAKAKNLDMSLSELMRRAAFAYTTKEDDAVLGMSAEAVKKSANSSAASIADTMSFIKESNLRVAAMGRAAIEAQRRATGRRRFRT